MTFVKYQNTNNASSLLIADISASATTILVTDGDQHLFPNSFPFLLTIEHLDSDWNVILREIVKAVASNQNSFTIVRWAWMCVQDDTASNRSQDNTAHAFYSWDKVSLYRTAEQVKDIQDKLEYCVNDSSIADEYDSTSTYSIGDIVMYKWDRFVCSTDILTPEEFDWTKRTKVSVDYNLKETNQQVWDHECRICQLETEVSWLWKSRFIDLLIVWWWWEWWRWYCSWLWLWAWWWAWWVWVIYWLNISTCDNCIVVWSAWSIWSSACTVWGDWWDSCAFWVVATWWKWWDRSTSQSYIANGWNSWSVVWWTIHFWWHWWAGSTSCWSWWWAWAWAWWNWCPVNWLTSACFNAVCWWPWAHWSFLNVSCEFARWWWAWSWWAMWDWWWMMNCQWQHCLWWNAWSGEVQIRYRADGSSWITNATWWTKSLVTIWWIDYCVHRFTSDWTFHID